MSLRSGKQRVVEDSTTGYQTATAASREEATTSGSTVQTVTHTRASRQHASERQGLMGPPATQQPLTPVARTEQRPEQSMSNNGDDEAASTTQHPAIRTADLCSRSSGYTPHDRCRSRLNEIAQRELKEKRRIEEEIADLEDKSIRLQQQRLQNRLENLARESTIARDKVVEEEERRSATRSVRQEDLPVEKTPIPQWLESSARAVNDAKQLPAEARMEELARSFARFQGRTTEPPARRSSPARPQPPTETTKFEEMMLRQTLPRDLPVFDGDPERWLVFATQLEQQAKVLTKGEVLSRLQRCLKGKAYQTVSALLFDPEQLPRIREVLERRFGRPDLLIERLINNVRRLPPLSSVTTTSEEIVDFTITVGNLLSSLKSMNRPEYAYNIEILRELEAKLSGHHLSGWSQDIINMYDGNPSLFHFGEYMDKIGRQATAVSRANWSAKPARPRETKQPSKRVYATEGRDAAPAPRREEKAASAPTPPKTQCELCGTKGHGIEKCRRFASMTPEERSNWVREAAACYKCLQKGHFASNCKAANSKSTHPLLRRKDKSAPPRKVRAPRAAVETAAEQSGDSGNEAGPSQQGKSYTCSIRQNVLLRVMPVVLRGPKGSATVLALLDEGSSVTLLEDKVAKDIGVRGKKTKITLRGIAGPHLEHSQIVSLDIRGVKGERWHRMDSVRTIEQLNTPAQELKVGTWKHLPELDIPLYRGKTKLLIGMDHYSLIAPRKIVWGPPGLPTATQSLLGWTLSGQVKGNPAAKVVYHASAQEETVDQLVADYLKTEEAGVAARRPQEKRHAHAEATLAATTHNENGRWETGLLWRSDNPRLPLSRQNALHRLKNLEKKLQKEPDVAAAYRAKIKDYVDKGYARKLTQEEARQHSNRTFYLPHFCVRNPNKPDKIRVVFDAASKVNGQCLNDALETGPDLLNPLIGILLAFRDRKVAFTADIKEMFLRIKIRGEDQDAQRFLWRDLKSDQEPHTYRMQAMLFGASSSPCSAQYVKNENARAHEKDFPEAVAPIIQRHYMDDFIDCADSPEEAIKLARSVTEVHRRGGFELCHWSSNSPKVLAAMGAKTAEKRSLNLGREDTAERVLGMEWDPTTDELSFNCRFPRVDAEIITGERKPTKRQMLSLAMSVFDPLGLLSPFTIKAKILLQQVWRDQTGWDQLLTDNVFQGWLLWLDELDRVRQCRVPRWYRPVDAASTLHVFCDASETAYAAVAYLVSRTSTDTSVAFVASKAKVAPLKPLTIPRMELMAAVIGSRLAATVRGSVGIRIDRAVMWTDSTTVAQWIRNDPRRYNVFVAHRLGEIDELTNTDDWRWLPTTENVADEATRGQKDSDLSQESRWFKGPAFLRLPEEDWPQETWITDVQESEVRAVCATVHVSRMVKMDRFSSWNRMRRSTAYALRFIRRCRRLEPPRGGETLTQQELEQATDVLVKQAQEEMFPQESRILREGGTVDRQSRLYSLSPRLNDRGHIVLDGRISAAKGLKREVKEPAILCSKHHLARLLIRHHHAEAAHQGQETVRNNLRQRYWVLGSRTAVRRAARECRACRMKKVLPGAQQMGRLPSARLTHHVRPFTDCAMDYFGPITVTIGRRHEKRYGVLITCLATRAVHIEVAASLTADSAIQAIVRMAARRGWPRSIHSDNATNFHGAERELREALDAMDKNKVAGELSTKGVDWYFIPASAPHMGGSWERMVRSVKTALSAILKEQAPREETLLTALAEAEFIINSRPITHVSSDHRDEEALTPNHFLLGSPKPAPPLCPPEERLDLRKQWRISQGLATQFWRRWVKEYLPALAKRTKWHERRRNITVNDVVFIADDNAARGTWARAVVTATYPGADGIVRVVELRTANGKTCRRPIAKVAVLLEADEEDTGSVGGEDVAAAGRN